jgi:hypothetical protein
LLSVMLDICGDLGSASCYLTVIYDTLLSPQNVVPLMYSRTITKGTPMQGTFSINFCDTCDEFGLVSEVNGKLMVQPCDCVKEDN